MDKKHIVELTCGQRAELCMIARSGLAPARRVIRAKVLLKADRQGEDWPDQQIAEDLGIGLSTVQRIRRRYAREGQAALDRRPQPPRPQKRRLDGRGEAQLLMLACSKAPDGHGRWTLDLLAERMVKLRYLPAISRDTVGRTLKKTRSSPG
jgi:transposase